jgi:hypothetical protein
MRYLKLNASLILAMTAKLKMFPNLLATL